MAVPHVSGVAALVWSHFTSVSAKKLRTVLEVTAENLGSHPTKDVYYGHGLVDANAAYTFLVENSNGIPTPSPTRDTITLPSAIPSLTPSSFCETDELNIEVAVTTDNAYYESSWEIVDSSGATVSNATFESNDAEYLTNLCLDRSECYTFTFRDSEEDGLFEDGHFNITVDGTMLLEDSNAFFSNLSVDFGDSCSEVSVCGTDELNIEVAVTTDNYSSESSWEIVDSSGATVSNATFESNDADYLTNLCLDRSDCYTFTFRDSEEDGLYGNGHFIMTVNGETHLEDDNDFFTELSVDFGDSCINDPILPSTNLPSVSPNPTLSPTVTSLPTISPNPTLSPTVTSLPTISPNPTLTTTASMSTICSDSFSRFKLNYNGRRITRDCIWVSNRATAQRCASEGVPEMCPKACQSCATPPACSD